MRKQAELLRHVADPLEQLRLVLDRPAENSNSPSLGVSVPVRTLTSVDLPAPFSPAIT